MRSICKHHRRDNRRTLDRVIRREMALVESDALNIDKLRDSLRNIRDLRFFERVEIRVITPDGEARTRRGARPVGAVQG
jgi:outer membrane protein assembly factor BamA